MSNSELSSDTELRRHAVVHRLDSRAALDRETAVDRHTALDRRTFLGGALAVLALPLWAASSAHAQPAATSGGAGAAASGALPEATRALLAKSPYVYISPLRANGEESSCHGEVWFGWIDDAVVVITAADRWKVRAIEKGLGRARLWVGDHGRWKTLTGRNEAFREAPSFDTRVSRSRDKALFDRMLALYETRYPAEIGTWRERFVDGFASGERWLLRYEPAS